MSDDTFQSDYLDRRAAGEGDSAYARLKARYGSEQPLAPDQEPSGAVKQPEVGHGSQNVPEPTGTILKDIGKGITETPRAVVKGARDAVQNTVGIVDDLGDWVREVMPQGGLEFGPKGVRWLNSEEWQARRESGKGVMPELPDLPGPKSVTGQLVKNVAQFITGFVGAGKVLKANEVVGLGKVATATAKGAVADFSVFDPEEERLSNLIEKFPALHNPVTDFLAAGEDDSGAEGRFKQAVEGIVPGVMVDGFVSALRGMRGVMAAKKAAKALPEALLEKIDFAQVEDLLGDAKSQDLVVSGGRRAPKTPPVITEGEALEVLTEPGGSLRAEPETFINFARIDTPEAVQVAMQKVADLDKQGIDVTRRGVRTHVQTMMAADQQNAWDVLLKRRAAWAAPLNAEQGLAARRLWVASAEKLTELAQLAGESPSETNLFAFRKMLATHYAIQREVIAARTETARALNAWKISAGAPEMLAQQVERMLDAHGGVDVTRKLAQRIANLAATSGSGAVEQAVERGVWVKTKDAVAQVYINALLLTNPQTYAVNMLSNTAVMFEQVFERRVANMLGKLAGSNGVADGEAIAMMYGQWQGFGEALRAIVKSRGTSMLGEDIRAGLETAGKVEVYGRALAADTWGMQNTLMGRFLDAANAATSVSGDIMRVSDELYKSIGYRGELNALALRQASGEVAAGKVGPAPGFVRYYHGGLPPKDVGKLWFTQHKDYAIGKAQGWGKVWYVDVPKDSPLRGGDPQLGVLPPASVEFPEEIAKKRLELVSDPLKQRMVEILADPPDSLKLQAVDAALYNTFQQKPAKLLNDFAKAWQSAPIFGRLTMPFRVTPINIMSHTMERTPFAPLIRTWREDVKAGGARAEIALARTAVGTGLLLAGMDLTLSGQVTGKLPADPGARQLYERMGIQGDSVKVGDKWYAYNRLDPMGMILGMGADLATAFVYSDGTSQRDAENWFVGALFALPENVLSKTYLSGMAEVIRAIQEPQMYGHNWTMRLAGTPVPAGVANIERQMQPERSLTRTWSDALYARLPFFSETLPLDRDLWGRPRQFEMMDSVLANTFNPIYSRTYDPQPVDLELDRLDYFPSRPRWEFRQGDTVLNLDDEPALYSRYVELAGNAAKGGQVKGTYPGLGCLDYLNAVTTGKNPMAAQYQLFDDSGKQHFIEKTITAYRTLAQQQLIEESPALQVELEAARASNPFGSTGYNPALLGGAPVLQ